MREICYIVIHCTAGPMFQTVESIQAYWKAPKPNGCGWKSPGYHHLIKYCGEIVDLQPISMPSNGVEGYNGKAIHISYIGGVEVVPGVSEKGVPINIIGKAKDTRSLQQCCAIEFLVRKYLKQFPNAIVLGHRDFSEDKNRNGIIEPTEWKKTCPSFSVTDWLVDIGILKKSQIRKNIAAVNVRSGAGINFKLVRYILPAGARVVVLQEDGEWSRCQINRHVGWIATRYLAAS